LATRVGAAITRRRPASAPPDAPSQDAEPAQPPATPPAPGTQRNRPSPAWALAVLRRHWLFAALLTAGLVLRVLTTAAYHPALIYVDTLKYLYGASPGSEPFGYTVALKFVLAVGS